MTYTVELITRLNGKFAGWARFEGFSSKRAAWDFIQAQGYTAADKNDCWMAYPE